MRCIAQILTQGTIKINETTHEITNETLILFTGIGKGDTDETTKKVIEFLLKTDFSDIYLISNYTILAVQKATKFSYHLNMEKKIAEVYFYKFVEGVKSTGRNVKSGVFGSNMEVNGCLVGDFILDF